MLEMEHLLREGSDHASLLLHVDTVQENIVKPFRFLNFWTKEKSFREVISNKWSAEFEGNPFHVFHHKLKKVKKALTC